MSSRVHAEMTRIKCARIRRRRNVVTITDGKSINFVTTGLEQI